MLALTLLGAGCASGADADPEITTTTRPGVAPTPPAKGAYFGAWAPPESDAPTPSPSQTPSTGGQPPVAPGYGAGQPGMAPVAELERKLGRQVDIVHRYRSWTSQFPTAADRAVLDGPRQLLVSWAGADTREVVSGRHDRLIRDRARAVKAAGRPMYIRWMRDMNGPGNAHRIHDAATFVAAWKHVRAIFAAEGVANVAWVWCPTAVGFGGSVPSFYPGDDQVDWICAGALPSAANAYVDLSEGLRQFFEWTKDRPKPLMVAEVGVPRSYGDRRPEWFRRAAETLQHPKVKAVVYFNSDERAEESRDTRRRFAVDDNPKAVSALRELATLPYFNPRNLPVTPSR